MSQGQCRYPYSKSNVGSHSRVPLGQRLKTVQKGLVKSQIEDTGAASDTAPESAHCQDSYSVTYQWKTLTRRDLSFHQAEAVLSPRSQPKVLYECSISRSTYSTRRYSLGISENVALAILASANVSDATDGMLGSRGGLSYTAGTVHASLSTEQHHSTGR